MTAISLTKRTEDATSALVSLLKKQADKGIDLGDLVAQVEIAVDFSGSMARRYPNEVQEAVERALALSLSGLDDDGIVPVHFFHNSDFPVVQVSKDGKDGTTAYQGFVADWASKHRMGGTNFAPTIQNILGGATKRRFGRQAGNNSNEKNEPPKLVLFVTDGDPSDRSETERLLTDASNRPIFWQFIGLGRKEDLAFLQRLNSGLPNRTVDNVGVTVYQSASTLNDTEFFDDVIGEFFTQWLPEARRLGITNC